MLTSVEIFDCFKIQLILTIVAFYITTKEEFMLTEVAAKDTTGKLCNALVDFSKTFTAAITTHVSEYFPLFTSMDNFIADIDFSNLNRSV